MNKLNAKKLLVISIIVLFCISITLELNSIPIVHAVSILRVQGNARGFWASGTSFNVSMVSTPTNGNLLILTFGSYQPSGGPTTITSITETNVNWATLGAGKQVSSVYSSQNDGEIWVGIVGAGASKNITINISVAPMAAMADVCEYSGLATSSFLDKTANANSNNPAAGVTGTTATTTQANELWIGTLSREYNQTTPTNGFTLLDGLTLNGGTYASCSYLEKIVSSTGAASSGTTTGPGYAYAGCIATFVQPATTVSVTFTSNPTGTGFITVNGSAQTSPYTIASANIGDHYTVNCNSPANTIAGQTQYIWSSWNDSGVQSHTITVSVATTYTATFQLQYYLTVTGGSSPTGAGWVNSGSTTTASNSWIWGRSGGSGNALTNWQLDGANQGVGTRLNTGSFTTPSITMSNYHTCNFVSVTQYQVTLDATTNSALASISSPSIAGDNYWYDSGATLNLNIHGVWGRGSGTGNRVTGYQINGGANNPISTIGTVQPFFGTLSGHEYFTANSVTQYQLTVSGGNNVAYGTASTVSGDTGWYDTGTSTTVSSDWIWGTVAGQSRTALSNWQLDSVNQNPVRAYTGTATISSVTMSATHALAFVSLTQYYITPTVANSTISPSTATWIDNGGFQDFTYSPSQSYYNVTQVLIDGSSFAITGHFNFTLVNTYHTISVTSADITAPTVSNVSASSQFVGVNAVLSSNWTDPSGISGFIMGSNNTGTWVNTTWTAFSNNPDWGNGTLVLKSTAYDNVMWEVWANDTSNNWGNTGLQDIGLIDNYSISLNPVGVNNPIVGDSPLDIDISVLKNGQAYTSYLVNESKDGSLSQVNVTGDFLNAEASPITRTFSVSGLYDTGTNQSISVYSVISLTVSYVPKPQSGSSGGQPTPTPGDNSTINTGMDFKISNVNLGTVKANSTVNVIITITYSGSTYTVTSNDVSLGAPFSSWIVPDSIQIQPLTQAGETDTTAQISLTLKIPASVIGNIQSVVTISGLDSFGVTHTASAKMTASIGDPSSANWFSSHWLMVVFGVAGIFAVLITIAKFSKRRHA